MRPAEIWQSPARPPYPPRTNHKLATRPATCPSTAHAPAVSLIHRRRRDVSVVKATAALFLVACLRLQNQIRITSRLRPSTADSRVISAPESIPTIAPYLLTHLYLHTRRRGTAALEHQLIEKKCSAITGKATGSWSQRSRPVWIARGYRFQGKAYHQLRVHLFTENPAKKFKWQWHMSRWVWKALTARLQWGRQHW